MTRSFFMASCFMLAAFALLLPAHAGISSTVEPDVEKQSRHDNTVYVGINWNFGVRDGAICGDRLSADCQRSRRTSNVEGWKAEATFVLSGANMGFGELRAKYHRWASAHVQGELGLGFSGAHEAFLLNGGIASRRTSTATSTTCSTRAGYDARSAPTAWARSRSRRR